MPDQFSLKIQARDFNDDGTMFVEVEVWKWPADSDQPYMVATRKTAVAHSPEMDDADLSRWTVELVGKILANVGEALLRRGQAVYPVSSLTT